MLHDGDSLQSQKKVPWKKYGESIENPPTSYLGFNNPAKLSDDVFTNSILFEPFYCVTSCFQIGYLLLLDLQANQVKL